MVASVILLLVRYNTKVSNSLYKIKSESEKIALFSAREMHPVDMSQLHDITSTVLQCFSTSTNQLKAGS